MYIAMNRFKVKIGHEEEFENIWKDRQSHLPEAAGFQSFHLLRGVRNEGEGYTVFASHSVWSACKDFLAWTRSQNFRDNHRNTRSARALMDGHPQFEGFWIVDGA